MKMKYNNRKNTGNSNDHQKVIKKGKSTGQTYQEM